MLCAIKYKSGFMLLFITKDLVQLGISSLNSQLQDIARTIQVMDWLFNFITWIPPQPLKYALRTNNIRNKFTTGTALYFQGTQTHSIKQKLLEWV